VVQEPPGICKPPSAGTAQAAGHNLHTCKRLSSLLPAAQARLNVQVENDLQAGLQRVREAKLRSVDSIAEAKQRIQEQDRRVLLLVQQVSLPLLEK